MNAIAGLDQGQLVFIHEASPTLEHDHDVEVGGVPMPTGASLRRLVRPDQLRNDFAARGFGDAEIPIEEEIAKAVGDKLSVALLDMRERVSAGCSSFKASIVVLLRIRTNPLLLTQLSDLPTRSSEN